MILDYSGGPALSQGPYKRETGGLRSEKEI